MGHKRTRRFEALEAYAAPKAELVKKSLCSWSFIASAIKTLVLIVFMYTFSITLTFYNKRYIHMFKFPLSITMTHLVIKFIIAASLRSMLSCKSKTDRVELSWKPYAYRILPPGFASALDIAFSNWSLEYITISLYTMTKSTVILFILGFAILLKLERFRVSLVGMVLFICAGLFLFTFQSTQFHLQGFLMVLGAAFLSGIRWMLSQLVLQRSEIGLTHPLDMMYHIQPWMMVALLPLSAGFEGLHLATSLSFFAYKNIYTLLSNLGILLAGAVIAFFLEFSEYLLLKHTSGLTLAISGIFKEICTLYLAVEINGDEMSNMNILGMLMCLSGIAIHIVMKAVKGNTEDASVEVDESVEMLMQNGVANNIDDDSDSEVDLFNVQRDR